MSVRGAAFIGIGSMVGTGIVDLLRNAPETFGAIVAMTLLAFVLDVVWKRVRDSSPETGPSEASPSVPSGTP